MDTKLLKANEESIDLACKLLAEGEIVALPTETVYGLAADATNSEAVKKIFEAKGRPSDNPLIVHISNFDMLKKITSRVPEDAKKLVNKFWPGPLTIIMPKSDIVCSEVCAGLDSVGVRMPSHPVAREIIEKSGIVFAAPSANLSGSPSPTNAADVFADMNEKIPLVIDGGSCDAGLESTVISVLSEVPIILRPGVITKEEIEKVLNKEVELDPHITEKAEISGEVLSPGLKYKHYSPKANVVVVKGSLENFIRFIEAHELENAFVMCFDGEQDQMDLPALPYGKIDDPKSQAHNLFAVLRDLDRLGAENIFVRCPNENEGVGLAVYNRIIRAAGFKIFEV